jgi:membrane protein CcdC involved in cytochrome C biogenesis
LIPDAQPVPTKSQFWKTPFFVLQMVSFLMILPLASKNRLVNKIQGVVTKAVFMAAGLTGLLLVFMWVGTDHQSTARNLNLIWAFPLQLLFIFKLNNLPAWLKVYAKCYSILVALLLLASILKPGIINYVLYPIMIAMAYETWVFSKKTN